MGEILKSPWTAEQVDALNRFQRIERHHEYTCGNQHAGDRTLFATQRGWICAHCDYTQDWALAAMVKIGKAELKKDRA